MSRPDQINLYVYEKTSANDLCDEVNRAFVKSGNPSDWFKVNFVSPQDDRETDYCDSYFVFDQD
ncbi:hypothetical protein Q2356_24790, partial [Escherichia coli]|nr:hypothetical protein [Escherichia coli]